MYNLIKNKRLSRKFISDEKKNNSFTKMNTDLNMETSGDSVVSTETIKNLINAKADVRIINKQGESILLNVCKIKGVSSQCIDMLTDESIVGVKDDKGNTALHCLSKNGYIHDVLKLHEKYDLVCVLNKKNQSFLHVLFKHARLYPSILEWMKSLRKFDVESENTDIHGNTYLHCICMNKNVVQSDEVCEFFKKYNTPEEISKNLQKAHPLLNYFYTKNKMGFNKKNVKGYNPVDILQKEYSRNK